jgi:glycine/D-amino acid oxidase-like deaminating enzyme
MRVVIIGAGVLGAAVAAGLTRHRESAGLEVTVLEARHPGAGTSGTTFAWINANNKHPDHYFALNHKGLRAHHDLAAGAAPWFQPTGNLEYAVTDEHRARLAARVDRLRGLDYPVRRLTAAQARELEPDLVAAQANAEYVFFPEEAHALPALLLARLLGEARDAGARIVSGARVTAIEAEGVRTAGGAHFPADVVVSCAGRWTGEVARLAGVRVPMLDPAIPGSVTVGWLAVTDPTPVRLSRVLTTSRLNLRPDGGGRLLLHALDLDAHADPAVLPDAQVAAEIGARLRGLLHGAESAQIRQVRVGQRSIPADGLAVAGFADSDARFYVLATHSGITLGPLLGELVAAELHGRESLLLQGFRPDRFTDGVLPAPPESARHPGEQ